LRVAQTLLWIDCSAGFLGGVVMLALRGWLSDIYGMPPSLLLAMAMANLAYGLFSFSLAVRRVRPRAMIVLLAVANATWATACGIAAIVLASTASIFGLAHLLIEGLLVGALAAFEWRWRELLLRAP